MPAEVKCDMPHVCYLAQHPGPWSAGEQESASTQRDTWEDKYSGVVLIIFKPECISTWYFFAKERSGDRKMKEVKVKKKKQH